MKKYFLIACLLLATYHPSYSGQWKSDDEGKTWFYIKSTADLVENGQCLTTKSVWVDKKSYGYFTKITFVSGDEQYVHHRYRQDNLEKTKGFGQTFRLCLDGLVDVRCSTDSSNSPKFIDFKAKNIKTNNLDTGEEWWEPSINCPPISYE